MKIFYKRKYPIGQFLNEDIGFEIEVPDDCEDVVGEVQTLKSLCDKAHQEINPDFYQQEIAGVVQQEPITNETRKEQAIQGVLASIKSAQSLKTLEWFKKTVDTQNIPELTEAYNNKFKTFQE